MMGIDLDDLLGLLLIWLAGAAFGLSAGLLVGIAFA